MVVYDFLDTAEVEAKHGIGEMLGISEMLIMKLRGLTS
jgi:hypothetical protein